MYPNLFRLPDWVPFLGGEPITSFGVMMLLSFLTAGYVLRAEMRRMGEDPEKAWDMVFMAVIGGIVGAKAYYVLLNYQRLATDPAGLIFSRGGLVWYGGFLLATALVVREIRRQKLPLRPMADACAPALALAYAVGRVGCFLVGDDWGRPTSSWVGIRFPLGAPPTRVDIIERDFGITVDPALVEQYGQVVPVHPTQLYEVGMSTLIFFFLWRIRRNDHQPGWLFMVWLVLAGLERFLVEFVRAKDDRFLGPLTLAQVISLAIVAVGVMGIARTRSAPRASAAT
jgi:phosphatidylglycerol:prolipoprotein diacylglycerol transferase